MGCAGSTPSEEAPPEPKVPPPPPSAPAGGSAPIHSHCLLLSVPVNVDWKGGSSATGPAIQAVTEAVRAQGEQGLGLAAIFNPCDGQRTGSAGGTGPTAHLLLFFSRKGAGAGIRTHVHPGMLHVKQTGMATVEAFGYEAFHAGVGQCGAAGWALGAVFRPPEAPHQVRSLMEGATPVWGLFESGGDSVPGPRTYSAVGVVVNMSVKFNTMTAAAPGLEQCLEQHLGAGWRLAGAHRSVALEGGLVGGMRSCVYLIFEGPRDFAAAVAYRHTVAEVKVLRLVSADGGSTPSANTDHLQQTVAEYAAKGWELAAIIDMPDQRWVSSSTLESTCRLVFQCPCS